MKVMIVMRVDIYILYLYFIFLIIFINNSATSKL